jgi:hypothetical protein
MKLVDQHFGKIGKLLQKFCRMHEPDKSNGQGINKILSDVQQDIVY